MLLKKTIISFLFITSFAVAQTPANRFLYPTSSVGTLKLDSSAATYTANYVVNNATAKAIELAGVGRFKGAKGVIRTINCVTDTNNTGATGGASFRLHFWNDSTGTGMYNNIAFPAVFYTLRAKYLGSVDVSFTQGHGTADSETLNTTVNLDFNCASTSTSLYMTIEALTAYVPKKAQNFYWTLQAFSQ